MWPFKKKQTPIPKPEPLGPISFTQVDTTERFDDNVGLAPDKWIATIPLNTITHNPDEMGLPPLDAAPDDVFRIASRLSLIRESIPILNDGVYCPVCHVANVELAKLRTPCPQCGRELLKFGWD